jgi:GR25 family glycosyltransferase involved in LPS biosynthesis
MPISYEDFQTYVVHYTPHKDRKRFLLNQFKKENLKVEFIEEYDREGLSYQQVYREFRMNYSEFQRRNPEYYSPFQYPMKPEEVSLCMKHKEAMRKFLIGSKKYLLLFEDDIILCHDFIEKFNKYVKEIPTDFDVGFIGQGVGARIPQESLISRIYWYKKEHPAVKCTDSMIFTRHSVEKLYNAMNQYGIAFPFDHEMSFWMKSLDMKVYWLEPPIVSQGSQTGYFDSFQDESSGKYVNFDLRIRKDMEELL